MINYTIRAEVIDIRTDLPLKTDSFFVDSNVWYWLTYSKASQADIPPKHYQTTEYEKYFSKALANGSKLFQSGLLLAELIHMIEKTEREIFNRINGLTVDLKEFRHNYINERLQVISEIENSWALVTSASKPIEILISESTTKSILGKLKNQTVDGYDYFILEAMMNANVIQILTDDGDFATIDGLQVFTSNQTVLNLAKHQSKIINR